MKDEKFEMSWEDAIRTVLAEKGEPMHYRKITEKIIENGYRINYGDTPEMSVGTILRLNDNLFRRVDRGVYELVETSVIASHSHIPEGEMSWEDAIRTVLAEKGEPMHYREITEKIIENGYRINYGDTPEISVGTILRLNDNLFRRVDRGVYELVETSVTERIDWDDIDWDTFLDDCVVDDKDGDDKKDDELSYKKASDFIKSSVLSEEEMELLELIVNFRLSLAKGEVCFADILDNLEVEISEEEKRHPQLIDKALLETKLNELKKQIYNNNNMCGDLYIDLRMRISSFIGMAGNLLGIFDEKVKFEYWRLGEFIPPKKRGDNPKVVIYYKNIRDSYGEKSCYVMPAVFVHEMFHAWNYFKAGKNSRSVMAIDEPMVEFETLYFLERLYDFASSPEHQLKNMVENVRNKYKYLVEKKQESIGDVAAYGFGYYLFENLRECDADSREWIETYSKKSASIDSSDKLVKKVEDALIPIYPFMSEKDVMEWFEKIIFGGKAISVTAQKSAVAKVGLDVSLRDLVLACIKTIGRKCFDAKELYAFAPIFEACGLQRENLENKLKQQLDELVTEGFLDALPHDCYSMKLAGIEDKLISKITPISPTPSPITLIPTPTKFKSGSKTPSIPFAVEFLDDRIIFNEKTAVKTFIESLKHIGLDNAQSVGIMIQGYNLVSDVERPRTGKNKWQDYVEDKYIYTKLSNSLKITYLYQIAKKLGINIKIHISEI